MPSTVTGVIAVLLIGGFPSEQTNLISVFGWPLVAALLNGAPVWRFEFWEWILTAEPIMVPYWNASTGFSGLVPRKRGLVRKTLGLMLSNRSLLAIAAIVALRTALNS